MRSVFIVHGWDGHAEDVWFPWLKNELENHDFRVSLLQMPETEAPKLDVWIPYLAHEVVEADEQTYFVGHSMGSQTIIRYLEALSSDKQVGGAVLVAPFFTLTNITAPEDIAIVRPWLETPIDYEKVKSHTQKLTAIFSDNDQFVPLENKALFEQRLGAKTMVVHNMKHFNEKQNPSYKQMPFVLQAVLDLAN